MTMYRVLRVAEKEIDSRGLKIHSIEDIGSKTWPFVKKVRAK
jgi:hypothetical protein